MANAEGIREEKQRDQSGSSNAVDLPPRMEMPSGQGCCSRVSSPVARLFQKGEFVGTCGAGRECFSGESQSRRSLD